MTVSYATASPVLLLIFNRPTTTLRVLDAIRQVRSTRLYVAADGPRTHRPGEDQQCAVTRALIRTVDWGCEVRTLFRDENLGCRRAVSSAIDWFFGQEAEGIILEDDCLPDPSFFIFCDQMLARYRHEPRVMHVGGSNFQLGRPVQADASYYFSTYAHVWGWATWRRAWQHYDVQMSTFPDMVRRGQFEALFAHRQRQRYWINKLHQVYRGEIDTWDYQWNFALWAQGGQAIVPVQNLVTNIGFGEGATHTRRRNRLADLPVVPLTEVSFCDQMGVDHEADSVTERVIYRESWWRQRINEVKYQLALRQLRQPTAPLVAVADQTPGARLR